MKENELRELDAFIAEHVYGARIFESERGSVVALFDANSDKERVHIIVSKHPWDAPSFNPTTDRAASMELLKKCVEKVREKQHAISIATREGRWCVCIHPPLGPCVNHETALTLELAIALFAQKLFSPPTPARP